VLVDECHRSNHSLWRQVLEYFDAFLVGLIATPSKLSFASSRRPPIIARVPGGGRRCEGSSVMRILKWATVLTAVAIATIAGFSLSVRGASLPPTIDDLDGTRWVVKVSGTEYDLDGGEEKVATEITWFLTRGGADTVNFDVILGGMIAAARYRGGYLLQSYSNDDDPPTTGSYLQIEVTGAPGKMKMKGQLTLFSTSSGIMRVQKISAKQIPNP
jgi:hypothetical protein